MKELTVNDFEIENEDYCLFSAYFDFWGVEVGLSIDLDEDLKEISEEELQIGLEKILKNLNPLLQQAENNREQLIKLLKEQDYIELANEWIAGAEEVEGKEGYFLIDDKEVHIPLTEEDFEKSFSCQGGIGVTATLDGEIEFVSFYLVFTPDYFAGHCIDCYLEKNGIFAINGLAG